MRAIFYQFPLTAITYFAVIPLLALGILCAYGQSPAPLIAQHQLSTLHIVSIIGMMFAHGGLVTAAYIAMRRYTYPLIVWGTLAMYLLWLIAQIIFFSKYSSYPSNSFVLDFVSAPIVFFGYTNASITAYDYTVMSLALSILLACSYFGIRSIPQYNIALLPKLLVWSSLCYSIGIYCSTTAPQSLSMLLREQFNPIYGLYFSSPNDNKENHYTLISPYLPRAEKPTPLAVSPTHVLLVILESVRADHLELYGYHRSTMPKLTARLKNSGAVYQHAYAPGPSTSSSFPVIFGGRYFSAMQHAERTSPGLFSTLNDNNIATAFISAGAMKWNNIVEKIGASEVDFLFHGSLPEVAAQLGHSVPTDIQNRNSVSDSILIEQYRSFITQNIRTPSFATLHYDGTHFPYSFDTTHTIFTPTLEADDWKKEFWRPHRREHYLKELQNSYDNSLRQVDTHIESLFAMLHETGILQDSVIIITADHGEALGNHGTIFHSTAAYEEQIHVPLLLYFGDNVRSLKESFQRYTSQPLTLVTISPTIAHLLGTYPPNFQGNSLASTPANYALSTFRDLGQMTYIRDGSNKYFFDHTTLVAHHYNLETDPREENNLWSEPTTSFQEFLTTLFTRGILKEKL